MEASCGATLRRTIQTYYIKKDEDTKTRDEDLKDNKDFEDKDDLFYVLVLKVLIVLKVLVLLS